MDSSVVMDVMQESLRIILKMSLPLLGASMIVGLVIAVFQAATQIHEQTLTFVPKLIAIGLLLLLLGGHIIATISDFTIYLFDLMTKVT
jgi:flagellar biosynthetic protein FliQ